MNVPFSKRFLNTRCVIFVYTTEEGDTARVFSDLVFSKRGESLKDICCERRWSGEASSAAQAVI